MKSTAGAANNQIRSPAFNLIRYQTSDHRLFGPLKYFSLIQCSSMDSELWRRRKASQKNLEITFQYIIIIWDGIITEKRKIAY